MNEVERRLESIAFNTLLEMHYMGARLNRHGYLVPFNTLLEMPWVGGELDTGDNVVLAFNTLLEMQVSVMRVAAE